MVSTLDQARHQNDYGLGVPKQSVETNVSTSIINEQFQGTNNVFVPKQEIGRTFYSSPKVYRARPDQPELDQQNAGYVAMIERNNLTRQPQPKHQQQQPGIQQPGMQPPNNLQTPQQAEPAITRHTYGSPQRRNNIHKMHESQQNGGNDFFSGFGQGGSGAPMRDQYGNVVTTRTRVQGTPLQKSVDQEQIKAKQQNEYYRDLQKQIEEQKAKKQRAKDEMAKLDLIQEQKIQKELQDLNERERADIAKERGEPMPQTRQDKSGYSNIQQVQESQLQDDTRTASALGDRYKRRDPNAPYQPSAFEPGPPPPQAPPPVPPQPQAFSQRSIQPSFSQQQITYTSRPPPIPTTLRPRPSPLAYSSNGNFMHAMSVTNGASQAHRDLQSQQMKLQSQLEVLHQVEKQLKNQNEQAQNDFNRMMTQLQIQGPKQSAVELLPGQSRFSLPGSTVAVGARTADDYKHQWNMVLKQDISGQVGLNAQKELPPVHFPKIQVPNSLVKAGSDLLKSVTPQGFRAGSAQDPSRQGLLQTQLDGQLTTETVRVPVDDYVPLKSRIEQKMRPDIAVEEAKSQHDKENAGLGSRGGEMDRTYVNNFLKEIDEIENINHRADRYIEDKTFETYMRNAPQTIPVQQAARHEASRQQSPPAAAPNQPAARSRALTPEKDPGELQNNSFFITESPDLHNRANKSLASQPARQQPHSVAYPRESMSPIVANEQETSLLHTDFTQDEQVQHLLHHPINGANSPGHATFMPKGETNPSEQIGKRNGSVSVAPFTQLPSSDTPAFKDGLTDQQTKELTASFAGSLAGVPEQPGRRASLYNESQFDEK